MRLCFFVNLPSALWFLLFCKLALKCCVNNKLIYQILSSACDNYNNHYVRWPHAGWRCACLDFTYHRRPSQRRRIRSNSRSFCDVNSATKPATIHFNMGRERGDLYVFMCASRRPIIVRNPHEPVGKYPYHWNNQETKQYECVRL